MKKHKKIDKHTPLFQGIGAYGIIFAFITLSVSQITRTARLKFLAIPIILVSVFIMFFEQGIKKK